MVALAAGLPPNQAAVVEFVIPADVLRDVLPHLEGDAVEQARLLHQVEGGPEFGGGLQLGDRRGRRFVVHGYCHTQKASHTL